MFQALKSLRLTQRFMLIFVGYFISLFVVIGTGWHGLWTARQSLQQLYEQSLQSILMAEAIGESTAQARVEALLAFQHAPGSQLADLHDHEVGVHLDAVEQHIQRSQQLRTELLAQSYSEDEAAMLAEAMQTQQRWVEGLGRILQTMRSGNFGDEVAAQFLALGRDEGDTLVALMGAFKGLQVANADEAYQQARQRYEQSLWIFALCVLFGAVPAAIMSVLLSRMMRRGFAEAQTTAQTIAKGDISRPVIVSGRHEIGLLLDQLEKMRTNLNGIIVQVRTGSQAIANASTEVAAGTSDLSARTEQQATALQQTTAASDALSHTVRVNADSAAQANTLAAQATEVAQRGGKMVSQVVATMQDINTSSRRIEDITGVIDSIAFQTNLLALNAAVEAARAGEQGKGFAVVATEVRSLAKRSASAAKEIKTLISESVNKVQTGTEQVERTLETMQDIVTGIGNVAGIVSQIAQSSAQQTQGLEQINAAVVRLDNSTQQNAALVEQTSAASAALQAQAQQLAAIAAQFVLDDPGSTVASVGSPQQRKMLPLN